MSFRKEIGCVPWLRAYFYISQQNMGISGNKRPSEVAIPICAEIPLGNKDAIDPKTI